MSDPPNKLKKRQSIIVQNLLLQRSESGKAQRLERLSVIDPNQVQRANQDNQQIIQTTIEPTQSRISLKEKVSENHTVLSWNSTFQYEYIKTDNLESLFLQKEPYYYELLDIIHKYNDDYTDLKNQKRSTLRNGPWRQNMCKKIASGLQQVIFTKDRLVQQQFLYDLYDWVQNELQINDSNQYQSTRPSTNKITQFGSKSQERMQLKSQQSLARPQTGLTSIQEFNLDSRNKPQRPLTGILRNPQKIPLNQTTTKQFQVRPISAISRGFEENIDENDDDDDKCSKSNIQSKADLVFESENKLKSLMPSEFIEHTMQDYKNKNRFFNQGDVAPQIRLQNFKRKLIIHEQSDTSQVQLPQKKEIQPEVQVEFEDEQDLNIDEDNDDEDDEEKPELSPEEQAKQDELDAIAEKEEEERLKQEEIQAALDEQKTGSPAKKKKKRRRRRRRRRRRKKDILILL